MLTAFVVSDPAGWSIIPAPGTREWMDKTPNRFAYRCLPLVIANQAGWIIPSPVGFRAKWSGDPAPGAPVEFVFDENPARWRSWISCHFGSGIVTFSLPWLFRTPEPVCLVARGVPNTWKHGIAALEGVIETYWSPFTFTMNWKLTNVGEWVRFEKDEPICFLQPLNIGVIENLTPRFAPLATDPQTKSEYDAWNQERLNIIHDPDRGMSWQKNYFQGRTMSGKQADPHRSKLAVRPFESK